MYPTGVFRFTDFAIEIQKGSLAQDPFFEVGICVRGSKQAVHFCDFSVYNLHKQTCRHRLRKKQVRLETKLPSVCGDFYVHLNVTMSQRDHDLLNYIFGEKAQVPSFNMNDTIYADEENDYGNTVFTLNAPTKRACLLSLMRKGGK